MDHLAKPIQKEYDRWKNEFGDDDPYSSSDTVGIHTVLRAHFLIADYFYKEDTGLGGIGLKSPELLHSALYRQFVGYDGKQKWTNSFDKCATLLYGLIKDHVFYDANKRTAFLVSLYHLQKFGRCPCAKQKEFEDFMVEIAENELSRYRRYKDFIRKKKEDPEVLFISDFLKRKSRDIDKRFYSITYRELNNILHKYDFGLINPKKNFIDIVRFGKRRKLFGVVGKREKIETKLGQIGFPGWKKQVGKGAINTVRKVTELLPKKGYDSDTFFHGTDPMGSLIDKYHAPLRRLANR
jgi:death-on-curing protein